MNNVMIDLETLGTVAGCSILSIGAVFFDDKYIGKEFYTSIYRASNQEYGLYEDARTLEWWEKQSIDAKKVFSEEKLSLPDALTELSKFVLLFGDSVQVWGNGSDFDNAMLQCAYKAIKQETPWKFWNNRCYRTLKNLRPEIDIQRIGTHHNALDDAKTQAIHAIAILNSIK